MATARLGGIFPTQNPLRFIPRAHGRPRIKGARARAPALPPHAYHKVPHTEDRHSSFAGRIQTLSDENRCIDSKKCVNNPSLPKHESPELGLGSSPRRIDMIRLSEGPQQLKKRVVVSSHRRALGSQRVADRILRSFFRAHEQRAAQCFVLSGWRSTSL